jgi:hypothetical protein
MATSLREMSHRDFYEACLWLPILGMSHRDFYEACPRLPLLGMSHRDFYEACPRLPLYERCLTSTSMKRGYGYPFWDVSSRLL